MSKIAVDPCIFVILGATGDLTHRKLLPALLRLMAQELLPENFVILGVARSAELDDAGFRAEARNALEAAGASSDEMARWCDQCLHFIRLPKADLDDFRTLAAKIVELERANRLPGNRAFYLSQPPNAFQGAITGLGESGLNKGFGWTRLVVEKPFGRDLASAQELNRLLYRYFNEPQIFRIDHYLGKETVQNLLVFRFANPIFESLWNRDRIESVQITVAETLGVEDRAAYYEQSGILRDMVQNHLTQLLATVAMEVPAAFRPDPVRNEKKKVLDSISPFAPGDAVFGQYAEGSIGPEKVAAYRQERNVAPDSQTPTFAAIRYDINNWRWHGVPFYLRTGKRLRRRTSEIVIRFRYPPVMLFESAQRQGNVLSEVEQMQSNILVITVQPDEGFDLLFDVKNPGAGLTLKRQRLHFRYGEVFRNIPEAYETLLLDFLTGDQTLFVRSDMVEASWKLYAPLLENPPEVYPYPSGTWGPEAVDKLFRNPGEKWFTE